jgi:uncharacterized Fe-S cluster-containing radical SAM superfamily enzyme
MRGELVASHDPKGRPVMFNRIKKLVHEVGDLQPVNRLELNTEGLLLLTNNKLLVGTHTHAFCLIVDVLMQAKILEDPDTGLVRKYR